MEPRDADPAPEERVRAAPGAHDRPDGLVPGNDRRTTDGQVALDDVEIGPADAARRDGDEDLARARDGIGRLLEDERPRGDGRGTVQTERAHITNLGPCVLSRQPGMMRLLH